MENNQNQATQPNIPAQGVPTPPEAPQVVSAPPEPEVIEVSSNKGGRGSKLILIILALVFLILLAGGAFYYYQMRQDAVSNLPEQTPLPSATPDPLTQEAEGIELEDVNGEFVEIDEDLKEL